MIARRFSGGYKSEISGFSHKTLSLGYSRSGSLLNPDLKAGAMRKKSI